MWFLLACAAPNADDSAPVDTGTPPPAGVPTLAVSAYFSGAVFLFDLVTGERVGKLPEAPGAQSVVSLPDGSWMVAAEEIGEIQHYAWDGTPLPPLLTGVPSPTAAIVGPDGDLYVSSFEEDRVAHYTVDGVLVGDFVAPGAGGLDGPDIGMDFGPDGNLYVPGWYSQAVHVYAPDGTWIEDVVTAADGLDSPRGIRWDEAGRLWVSGQGSDNVLVWDGSTVVVAAEPRQPVGFVLEAGQLLVASYFTENVRAYDAATGEGQGVFAEDEEIEGITYVGVVERAPP